MLRLALTRGPWAEVDSPRTSSVTLVPELFRLFRCCPFAHSRLLCPLASWTSQPPAPPGQAWTGFGPLGGLVSWGGAPLVQATTRHLLLPDLPTSLDLHGVPVQVLGALVESKLDPEPSAPATCVLTSFLGLPLGPGPGLIALYI